MCHWSGAACDRGRPRARHLERSRARLQIGFATRGAPAERIGYASVTAVADYWITNPSVHGTEWIPYSVLA